MIYIATVHWQSDQWIDIQNKYLLSHIKEEFRVFAFLNDIPNDHSNKFYYSNDASIRSHEKKLNILATEILQDSENDDDLIIFMDGDAFPIGDIIRFAREHLKERKLIAVRRTEENGEQQPHPCFCITTIRFWKKISGDWRRGFRWKDHSGKYVTDVGGNLLGLLLKHKTDWLPLLRSNKNNIHSVLFAVYGNLVYHHGAGFRKPSLRINNNSANRIHLFIELVIQKYVPKPLRHIFPSSFRYKFRTSFKAVNANLQLSKEIYNKITHDPNFINSYFKDGNRSEDFTADKYPLCVIIIGMYQNGTNRLAAALKDKGLYGGQLSEEGQDNTSNSYAKNEFSILNTKVLEYSGGTWDRPPSILVWNKKLAFLRDKLIIKSSEEAPNNDWYFNDTATILTLPFWLEGLSRFKLVGSVGHPLHIAHSLAIKNHKFADIQKGYDLWYTYNLELLKVIRMWGGVILSDDLPSNDYNKLIKEGLGELYSHKPMSTEFYTAESIQNDQTTTVDSIPEKILDLYSQLVKYSQN